MDDILVLVQDCEAWQPHVRYAADLAIKLHGSLNAIYVAPRRIPVPTDAPAAFAEEIVEIYREEATRARRADGPFMRWAAQEGVRHSSWRVAQGAPTEVLEAAANWHDLVVLKAHAEPFGEDILETGSAIIRAGLPSIILPAGVDKVCLDTIAIAWNGSPPCARAVRAALPLLRGAKRIVVVRAGRSNLPARDEAERFLERHELRCERLDIDADEHDAGEPLIGAARHVSADIVVLGAYGRSRFSEWMFGGVTRYALQHVALPMLMHY